MRFGTPLPKLATMLSISRRFRVRGQQPEQVPRLGVVVAVGAVIVACDGSADGTRPFDVGTVLRRAAEAVRLIVHRRTPVSVEAHRAVLVVSVIRALRFVYRQGIVVCPAPGAVGVGSGGHASV